MVEIDLQVLRPWRNVAWILGISTAEYLERYLEDIGDSVEIHQEIADTTVRTRARAERVAERLEKFTVDAQLSGRSDTGTVAASVAETGDGRWRIKDGLSIPGQEGQMATHIGKR